MAVTEAADEALIMEVVSPRAERRSKLASRSSSSIGGGAAAAASIEYTSLRDMIVEGGDHQGGSWREYSGHDIHDFDKNNIGIRNQLLKHAASAYLQSAVVVPARDQSCCLGRLWRQMQMGGGGGRRRGGRGRVLRRACSCSWPGCVDDPAAICARFVARYARLISAFFADRVAGIWA